MASRSIYEAVRIERRSGRHSIDFSVKTDEKSLGFYTSLKNAEKAIAKCIKDFEDSAGWTYGLVGFYVTEFKLDRMLKEKDVWSSIYESQRTYTKDGKPFSFSFFPSDWKEGIYGGTLENAIKFNVGDYAWMNCGQKIVPVKVLARPLTPKEWANKFDFLSDASDDCYLVMTPSGHVHPQTVDLFPIDEKLPLKVIKQIEAAEKEY